MNFYNENDPKMAAWLRELISAGELPSGVVDERSITEIDPQELHAYTQCHFFAGIGGWAYALQLANWPDDKPIWTGSCPCAGQRKGHADERHLWPAFYRHIAECSPAIVLGEQVAGPDGREWFAGVRADLEGAGYACGAADLCAAGAGAPHPRQRIYWMAYAQGERRKRMEPECSQGQRERTRIERNRPISRLADTGSERVRAEGYSEDAGSKGAVQIGKDERQWIRFDGRNGRSTRGLVLPDSTRRNAGGQGAETAGHRSSVEPTGSIGGMDDPEREQKHSSATERFYTVPSGTGAWSNFDICHFTGPDEGKARRVEAGTFPLAPRLPRGVVPNGDPSVSESQASGEEAIARLRGYGNAIVPQVAAEFIRAAIDAISEHATGSV